MDRGDSYGHLRRLLKRALRALTPPYGRPNPDLPTLVID